MAHLAGNPHVVGVVVDQFGQSVDNVTGREQLRQIGQLNGIADLVQRRTAFALGAARIGRGRFGGDDLLEPDLVTPNRRQQRSIVEAKIIKEALGWAELKLG